VSWNKKNNVLEHTNAVITRRSNDTFFDSSMLLIVKQFASAVAWSRRWESNPVYALIWSFAVYKAARGPYTSPGHFARCACRGLSYERHELEQV